MNLTSPAQVREWCQSRDFHPNRTLGQNFLIDRNILDAIVAASGVHSGSRVLEIGPGLGVVTAELLRVGARVTAVEKDHRLAAWLSESLAGESRLTLLAGDALEMDWSAVPGAPFDAVVSNLPYSVGTRILLDLVTHRQPPASITVTVQLEVAERLAAPPGGHARGQAGVWVQRAYDVTLVRVIKPTCFWPKPEISSALVHLVRHDRHVLSLQDERRYLDLTRHAFMHRRKQLAVALRHAPAMRQMEADAVQAWLVACGVDPRMRAEDLSVEQWCRVAQRWPDAESVEALPQT